MARDAQLQALLKARELDEQRAAQRHAEIERVAVERARVCEDLEREIEGLRRSVDELQGPKRVRAAQSGDAFAIGSVTEYAKRLERKMDTLAAELAEKTDDHNRAQERLRAAEQEVVAARVERKRVERLLEERTRQDLIQGSALEESAIDDLMVMRRRDNREE